MVAVMGKRWCGNIPKDSVEAKLLKMGCGSIGNYSLESVLS